MFGLFKMWRETAEPPNSPTYPPRNNREIRRVEKMCEFPGKTARIVGCHQFTVCSMTCGCASRLRRAPTFCLRSNWGRPDLRRKNERFKLEMAVKMEMIIKWQ